MSSSASNGICSQDSLCSSDYACSSPSFQQTVHFDDNSEDIKSTGSKEGDDPDSAELFHASDQDPHLPDSDNSAAHDVSCHVQARPQLRHHQRNVVSG